MKNRLIKIVVFLLLICTFIVVSILVPYKVLKNVLKEYYALSAIFIFFVILVLLLMIKTFLEFKNKVLILKNKDEQIYIRDVEVEYSPAVLSYLMNGEIEIEKDLSATLLNLCAKNILKLEKNKIGKFDIIDLKNNKEVEKLSADEKYAYIMFTDKMDNETVDVWKKIVKNEYEKYKFSKRTKKSFEEYATLIFAIFFVIMAFIGLFIQESRPDIMNFVFISVVVGFFAIYEIYIFKGIKLIITRKFEEKKLEQYTVKGAKEYIRWQRFIKFIKEYTLIEEQQLDSVVVLRKYLSYSMALGINTNYNSEILYKLMGKHVFDTKEFFVLWLNNRF